MKPEEYLLDWFEGSKLGYEYSHKFRTLSGWHYIFKSKNDGKRVCVEFFEDEYDCTKMNLCLINSKDIAITDIKLSDNKTDDGIERFNNCLIYLESLIK